jgi:ribosomal protein S18 acetylase RimI-like enzyme
MRIQRLQAHEADRLRAIRLRALQQDPDAFGSTYASNVERPMSVWKEQAANLPTWLAVVDSTDAGMVRAAPHSGDPETAYLISMWVAPEARGRGAGSALVSELLDWARAADFERVVLDVGDENSAAIALYAKHGFKVTGNRSRLDPPRDHITEHERVCVLSERALT